MKDSKPSGTGKYGPEPETKDKDAKGIRRILDKVKWLIESGRYIAKERKAEKAKKREGMQEDDPEAGAQVIAAVTADPSTEAGGQLQAADAAGVQTVAETVDAEPDRALETASNPDVEAAHPEQKEKKARSFQIGGWRYSVKRIVLVSVAILLAVGIGLAGQFSYIVFAKPQAAFTQPTPIPQDIEESPDPDDEYMDDYPDDTDMDEPEEPTPTPDPYADVAAQAEPDFSKDIVNVLLIGADYSEEREDWHRYNSDVMIVLAMNFKQNKADLISVPRDTYAKIYKTSGHYKLNSSMYFGGGYDKNGPEYVMRSVEGVLGNKVAINSYIGVDMPALKELVDALGGVDYKVDVRITLNGRVVEPGMQHLDGQQVVDYCRARKGIDNDLGRVDRQKNILFALFKKMRDTKSLASLPDILKAMEGKVRTNLSFQQICAMVVFGSKLSDDKIKLHTLPGDFHLIFNSKFVVLDQKAKVRMVKEIFGVNIKADSKYGYTYAMREWQTMMASQCITKVQKVLDKDSKLLPGQQKITPEQRLLLETDINDTKAAIASRNTSRITAAKDKLQADANTVTAASGLSKINWDVDQNPGKKHKY